MSAETTEIIFLFGAAQPDQLGLKSLHLSFMKPLIGLVPVV